MNPYEYILDAFHDVMQESGIPRWAYSIKLEYDPVHIRERLIAETYVWDGGGEEHIWRDWVVDTTEPGYAALVAKGGAMGFIQAIREAAQ